MPQGEWEVGAGGEPWKSWCECVWVSGCGVGGGMLCNATALPGHIEKKARSEYEE